MDAIARYIAGLFPTPAYGVFPGFCIPQIWMYVIVQAVGNQGITSMAGFHCASALALLLSAGFFYLHPHKPCPRWISIAGPVGMALLPLSFVFGSATGPSALSMLLSIVAGLGCAW